MARLVVDSHENADWLRIVGRERLRSRARVQKAVGDWQEPTETTVDLLHDFYREQFKAIGERVDEDHIGRILETVRSEIAAGDEVVEKGGPGSGNFGHAGRPGHRGGSASSAVALLVARHPAVLSNIESEIYAGARGLVRDARSVAREGGYEDEFVHWTGSWSGEEMGKFNTSSWMDKPAHVPEKVDTGVFNLTALNRYYIQESTRGSFLPLEFYSRALVGEFGERHLKATKLIQSMSQEVFRKKYGGSTTMHRSGGLSGVGVSMSESRSVANRLGRFFGSGESKPFEVRASEVLFSHRTIPSPYAEKEWVVRPPSGGVEKGGPGSGNFGHTGRPGHRGGSAGGGGAAASPIDEAATFVKRLTLSGGGIGDVTLSDDARAFLAQTVTKPSYNLYRGIGLVKGRASEEHMREVRGLQPGDPVPEYLAKQHNPYASYTTKRSVAKYYSSGKVSVVVQAKVSRDHVVVDTRNLREVLRKAGREDLFDADDYAYFKDEAEVLVREPVTSTILSSKAWVEKAVLTLDEHIEALLAEESWWMLSGVKELEAILQEMSLQGLNAEAGRIEALRKGLSEAPYLTIDWNLDDPRMVDLVARHGAESVTNVNEGTRSYLRDMIKQFVEEGIGRVEAVERLKTDRFGLPTGEASKFTENRLSSIVAYETNRAMSGSAQLLRDELGLKYKQWFTNQVSPCEICLDNEDQGVVKSTFPYTGVFGPIQYPPAHPQTCRCVCTSVESEVRAKFAEMPTWPMERNQKSLLCKADPYKTGHAMVAFYIPQPTANLIAEAAPTVEDAEKLHVTLVYLGETPLPYSSESVAKALQEFAETHAPVSARLKGTAEFDTEESGRPFYLKVESVALLKLRSELVPWLADRGIENASEHPGYTPHVTLAYLDEGEEQPEVDVDEPVTFSIMTFDAGRKVGSHHVLRGSA